MDSNKNILNILTVPARANKKGRISTCLIEIDISGWAPTSLFRRAMIHQVAIWKLTLPSSDAVYRVRRAIPHLSEQSRTLLNLELAQLTREDVARLLQSLDNDFAAPSIESDDLADNSYFAIRQLAVRLPGALKDGLTFEQAAKPHILNNRRWRKFQLPPNNLPPVLGHISHTDLRDLRQKTETELQSRKTSIEQAATREIEAYELIFSLHNDLLAEQLDQQTAITIEEWATCAKLDDRPFPLCMPRQFAAVLLRVIRDHPPPLDASGFPRNLRLPRSKLDWAQLPQVQRYRFSYSLWPWFFVQQRLPNDVLTAIFVLLLSHTGWNPSSIGSLTIDSITQLPQGGYRLQGYKSKTDDQTPVSEVPRYLKAQCKAIDLLLWNHHQLGRLGILETTRERRVWYGWQANFETTSDVISPQRIERLCKRHEIDYFTPSELRPIKAALTYLHQRDLEAVRVLLGHTDLVTSESYLENTLFFRLNEAMMLEFQRRIEATLTYATGGDDLLLRRSLLNRHVDRTLLLVPTGDGGACANFFDGPGVTQAEPDEPCAGLACQSGTGCSHYRLIVNVTTIEMALRTRLYYRSRWQRLCDNNPVTFSQIHLPKILYMYVLLRIVRERRPDLYAQAEMSLG